MAGAGLAFRAVGDQAADAMTGGVVRAAGMVVRAMAARVGVATRSSFRALPDGNDGDATVRERTNRAIFARFLPEELFHHCFLPWTIATPSPLFPRRPAAEALALCGCLAETRARFARKSCDSPRR